MERPFSFAVDEFYHVYSRGVDKRKIFDSNEDRVYFQKLLFLTNSTERIILRNLSRGISVYDINREDTLVDIGGYALMPNHIHLLLHEKQEHGISTFMSKLLTAYAVFYNKKVARQGALFDGRFRAKHAGEDSYMHYLYAYIPLNIVKLIQPNWKEEGIKNLPIVKQFLDDYPFSSYLDYLGNDREESVILNREPFPEYFHKLADFKDFIHGWLTYKNEEL
ncbi:MAG: transposase [Candidatus Vogelbacteria bacterium]|nr:transposase [Candidatus Vogelbacteria bacterium]